MFFPDVITVESFDDEEEEEEEEEEDAVTMEAAAINIKEFGRRCSIRSVEGW